MNGIKDTLQNFFTTQVEDSILKNSNNILNVFDNELTSDKEIVITSSDNSDGGIKYIIDDFKINDLNDKLVILSGNIHISIKNPSYLKFGTFNQTIIVEFENNQWVIKFNQIIPTFEKKTKESFIDYYAHRDGLTGILNREGFEKKATEKLRSYNSAYNTALFMIDLDDFKIINDKLGHQTGDLVLKQVAKTLTDTFRTSDVIGRIGGDEFMVLMTGDFSNHLLSTKANEVLNTITLTLEDGKEILVSVSVGVAYGKSYMTFERLYRTADVALYSAKNAGKNRYRLINIDTNMGYTSICSQPSIITLQDLLDNEETTSLTPYEALIQNIPGGVLVLSFTDTVKLTYANDWIFSYTGYSKSELEDLQSSDVFALVHPEDRSTIEDAIEKIRKGVDKIHVIYRIRKKDHTYGYVQVDASMTERTKNEIVFHGIEIDVDEMFELKHAVEEAHTKLKKLFNAIPGGVMIITIDQENVHLDYCNHWISRFLGYDSEEAKKFEVEDPFLLVHPDELKDIESAIRKMRDGEDFVNIVYRLKGKDNVYRHIRLVSSIVERNNDKAIYYGIATDVEEMNIT